LMWAYEIYFKSQIERSAAFPQVIGIILVALLTVCSTGAFK